MAGFAINFDATKVRPNTGTNTILDDGEYNVHIISTDEKPAKNTPGATFVEVVMQILDGPNKGDRMIDRLNLKNPNQQAVDIAYGTLSAICYVTGRLNIQNTMQLHGVPFKIEVRKVPRADKPDQFGNEVKRYMDINGNAPGEAGGSVGSVGGAVGGVPQQQPVAPQLAAQQPGQPSFVAPAQQPSFAAAQQPGQPSFVGTPAPQAPQTTAPAGNAAPSWAQ